MEPRTIATVLDGVAAWVASEVSPKLEYLVPPDEGDEYGVEAGTSHPAVYQAFVPGEQWLSDGEHQAPSIAVQLMGGTDAIDGARALAVRLVLTIWAPGHFGDGGFERSHDGWRDLYNGLDEIACAVRAAECIAGCTVNLKGGVRYGFYDIDGEVPDLYPYWMGKVEFELAGSAPANKRFESFL